MFEIGSIPTNFRQDLDFNKFFIKYANNKRQQKSLNHFH